MNQRQKILRHLAIHGYITGLIADDLFRIRDLPKRVSELREQGYTIEGTRKVDMLGGRYIEYTVSQNERNYINGVINMQVAA